MADLEAKKAELARLKALKAMKEQGADIEQMQATGSNPQAKAWAPPGQQKQPEVKTTYGYAYDDEDDYGDGAYDNEDGEYYEDDDFDAALDAFEEEAAVGKASVEAAGSTAALNTHMTQQAKGEVSQFEVLRLAKIGDTQGFLNLVAEDGVDIKTFKDNKERSCLHYAADSSNVELITALVQKEKVPVEKDELGMTPYDICVLLGDTEGAKVIAAADSSLPARSRDEVLRTFAPAPPKLSISKPAPPAPFDAKRPRSFWGPTASTQPALAEGTEVSVFPPGELPIEATVLAEAQKAAGAARTQGIDWALAVRDNEWDGLLQFAAVVGGAVNGSVVGGVVLAPLLGVKAGSVALSAVVAGGYFLGGDATGTQSTVASAMLRSSSEFLTSSGMNCCVFRTPVKLPVAPVCTVKWYRRLCDVSALIASGDEAAACIFNDFVRFETTLRTDAILRGTPTSQAVTAVPNDWYFTDSMNAEDKATMFGFIATAMGNSSCELKIASDGPSIQQVFGREGMFTFTKMNASNNAVTDVVVLRTLQSRYGDAKVGAIAYIQGKTMSGDALLTAAAAMGVHVGFQAVYTTNTFGLTDKDLRLSFFEESVGSHEFVYAVESNSAASKAVGTLKPAQIGIPLSII